MPHSLAGERHAFVHLGDIGDAYRTAGAHDDVERGREGGSQPELGDGLLVAAADVHHRDRRAAERSGQIGQSRSEGVRAQRISKLELLRTACARERTPTSARLS